MLLSNLQQYKYLPFSILHISRGDYHSLCTSAFQPYNHSLPILPQSPRLPTCAGSATIYDQPSIHQTPARVATRTRSDNQARNIHKAADRTMDKSLLGKLPLELRLHIYERALHVEEGLRITLDKPSSKRQRSHTKKANRTPTRSTSQQKNLLAIRASCKEVYLETDGIVSAVNNSWVFVHCEDNTTAWGKRTRRWLLLAGLEAQKHVQSVQFDIGVWTKQKRNGASRVHSAPTEATAMWHHLPKLLKQRSVDFSIKLTVEWTSGMKLFGGGRAAFGPCVYTIPMWAPQKEIKDAIQLRSCEQQDQAHALVKVWRDSWTKGDGELPAFTSPPRFNTRAPRFYREMDDFWELSCALVKICEERLRFSRVQYVQSSGSGRLLLVPNRYFNTPDGQHFPDY